MAAFWKVRPQWLIDGDRRYHHRHQHGHRLAAAPIVLVLASLEINIEENSMKATMKWTTPAQRKDGTALALTDIQATNVLRNGILLATVSAVDSGNPLGNSFDDTTPLTGADTYVIETVTTDGLTSGDSNALVINVVNANPAAAITDLQGSLVNDDGSPIAPAPAAASAQVRAGK